MADLFRMTFPESGPEKTYPYGMREMQARVWARRNARHLLIKAPPASGKSRALMYLALDKIRNQGLTHAIVAVPEISIGGSFANAALSHAGFFDDWRIEEKYNLCLPGNSGKTERLLRFLKDAGGILLCTHATLRYGLERLEDLGPLNSCLVAIDEFHHVSEEEGNRLGAALERVMENTDAHIAAMTGSYFRGDQIPILRPEVEARFAQVTYTWHEQLKSCRYLKSLGIGYHFYQGRYLSALAGVLDLSRKTIIHIPAVTSRESSGFKLDETDAILDLIGDVEGRDENGILLVRARDGRLLRVADLVTDDAGRPKILAALRGLKKRKDLDLIIALGLAKEGFDWPFCEHVLTIGYRNSLTEVVQIIGRATRDCEGKSHAQFTNLIARPDAEDDDVRVAVNSLLKAIALSLLMREVLSPNITFRPRSSMAENEKAAPGEIVILDSDRPLSGRVREILENGGVERVVEELLTRPETMAQAIASPAGARIATEIALPGIIMRTWPDLPPTDVGAIRDMAKTHLALRSLQGGGAMLEEKAAGYGASRVCGETGGSRRMLAIGDRLISVDELCMDLVDSVNPFQGAYEILSRAIDAPLLKTIQDYVISGRGAISEAEAVLLWPEVERFYKINRVPPDAGSLNVYEARLGEALAYIRSQKARKLAEGA